MNTTDTSLLLWNYYWKYIANLRYLTATDLVILEGLTPFEWLYKNTYDIDEYTEFKKYQQVVFHGYDKPNKEQIEGTYTTSYGTKRQLIITKGIDLYIEMYNGNISWFPVRDLKESDPLRVVEYAKDRNIDHLPAFARWVPHALKKRENNQSCYQENEMRQIEIWNYGAINSKKALKFDCENKNAL